MVKRSVFNYCKPKACSAGCLAAAFIYSVKSFENSFLMFFWYAYSCIRNANLRFSVTLFYGNNNFSTFTVIFNGIIAKIIYHLFQKAFVAFYYNRLTFYAYIHICLLRFKGKHIYGIFCRFQKVCVTFRYAYAVFILVKLA